MSYRSKLLRRLAFGPLLLLALPAAASDWQLSESGATRVYAPSAPAAAATARRLAEGVEARRLLLSALLEQPLPPVTPAAFYLLPDAETGREFGVAPGNVRTLRRQHGVFGMAVLPLQPAQERQLAAAALAALLEDHLAPLPLFWRSGFAEYLLDAELTPQGVRPLATAERLEILENNDWLSLSQFSELDLEQHGQETRRRLASQVWALLYHDLVVAPKKKEKLLKFVRGALAGDNASTAYMAAYGTYYDDVQIDVRDASRRSNGQAFAKFAATFPVDLPPFAERPLPPADADAELGLMLAELPSPAAAASRCGAAREREPAQARALLCEARLLEQSGELAGARAGYEKALAAAPGDRPRDRGEIAYFAGAAWLAPSPDDPAADPLKALAHLRLAREAWPAQGDAWAGAALAAYPAKPRPADAMALAEEAHRQVPGRTDVSLALFRLYRENGREAEANQLAARDVQLRRKVPAAPGGALRIAGPPGGQAHLEELEASTALIAAGNYEEALARLVKVRQGADNPSLADALDARIAELRQTIAHNQFVGKFNAAAEHFNHQRWDDTIAVLEELLPGLADEQQKKKAGDLLAQARRMKGEYARIAAHNRFVAVLNQATALYNQKKFQDAAAMVERQLAVLTDAEDLKLARSFIEECRKNMRRGGG